MFNYDSDEEQEYLDYFDEHYQDEHDDVYELEPQHILIDAIFEKNIDAVRDAINICGVDIIRITNDINHYLGNIYIYTPVLHIAIRVGNIDIVLLIMNILLASGENIDMTCTSKNTCLHVAVNYGHRKIVQELVNAGADVNARNNNGETPLHLACSKSNWSIVRYLLAHGSDMYATDNIGQTCLHHVSFPYSFNYKLAQKLLFRGLNVNQKDNNGLTPLHTLVKRGYTLKDMILLFLKYGANINEQDNEGKTPFHYIQNLHHINCIQVFLENGADLEITDNEGNSCMSLAMSQPILHSVLQEILSFLKIREDSYYTLVIFTYLQQLSLLHMLDCDSIDYLRDFTDPIIKHQNNIDDW
jgi:ankyrin repeat protein